ncbi:MAG: flagellar hook-length control protein FliK [Pirellulales bacterium]|nr:flagellar hook-length control protein FliK [Pirellulales bacterium]
MSASPIDALLQLTPAPRAAEASSRGGRDGRAFGPALEHAYASEKAREAPAAADEEPVDAAPEAAQNAYNEDDGQAETAADRGEITPPGEAASDEADDAKEAEEAKEETLVGEVEVSELASVALAAEEAQTAMNAEEFAAAMLGGQPEEVQPTGDAEAPSTEEEAADASTKLAGNLSDQLSGNGDEAAKGEAAHAKGMRSGKRTGDGVETAIAENDGDKLAEELPANGQQILDEAQPLSAKSGESAERSTEGAKQEDSRLTKGDGAEKLALPPVDQSAELTAAIERQVKLIEPSGATEGSSAESPAVPAVDASNGGNSTQRAAATLDRVAAASLRRSDETAQTDGGPQIDRPRFVQRVEGALRAAQQRDGRIQVRLAPPELGVVHIELAVQNGVMTAKLEAETATARNALLDNLPALRERLAEQNIRVEKFDVDVRRDPQQGGGNNAPGDRPDGQGESNPHGRRGRPATSSMTAATPKATPTTSSTPNAGLDVRI